MSVYKHPHGLTYEYDFTVKGRRYRDTTGLTDRRSAEEYEAALKSRIRLSNAGMLPTTPDDTPTFSAWAGPALAWHAKFIKRPDVLERTFRMVLAFWGAAPKGPRRKGAVPRVERVGRPHHNLRLGDPIADPNWLNQFEQWMTARGIAGSTRNSYLSACSDLYTAATQPEFRALTGITENPFAGIRRSPTRTRVMALTPAQVLALVEASARHIAHALTIAALAPKLRVASILALRWDVHIDRELTRIQVPDHKTSRTTGLPQVVHISSVLRAVLEGIRRSQQAEAVKTRRAGSGYVITWRGQPVASMKRGLSGAVRAIGLTWGSAADDGVTFHTLRHSIATLLADATAVGHFTERLRADLMGHREIRTTQKYTHLNAALQAAPHAALAAALPGLTDAIAAKTGERKKRTAKVLPHQPVAGRAADERIAHLGKQWSFK